MNDGAPNHSSTGGAGTEPLDPVLARAIAKLLTAAPDIFATMASASKDSDMLARRWGLSFEELRALEAHYAVRIQRAKTGALRPSVAPRPLPAIFDRSLPPRDRVEGK